MKTGKGKGTLYAVNPEYIRQLNFKMKTTLKSIEDHRLEELLYTDIKAYPNSSFGEIHDRIGEEIPKRKNTADIKNHGGIRGYYYFEFQTLGQIFY